MSNISKCLNFSCPLKDKCWRFTAPANSLCQSYGSFQYEIIDNKVVCDGFWDNKDYRNEDYTDRI